MLFDKQIVPNDHHHFAATKRTNCNTTFWMPMRHERLPQVRRRCSASRSPRPWYRCVADRARKMAGWRAASRRFRPAGPFRPADQETPGVPRARAGRRRTGALPARCPRLSHRAADRRPRVRIMCPPLNTSGIPAHGVRRGEIPAPPDTGQSFTPTVRPQRPDEDAAAGRTRLVVPVLLRHRPRPGRLREVPARVQQSHLAARLA